MAHDGQGLFGGRWYYKLFNLIFFLGGLAMGALGKGLFLPRREEAD